MARKPTSSDTAREPAPRTPARKPPAASGQASVAQKTGAAQKTGEGQMVAAGKSGYAKKPDAPKRRKKQLSLARVAEPLISQALRARGHATLEVIRRWPHIVGAELAAASEPVELKMRGKMRSEGVLTVRVESGFAVLFEHRKPYLIDRINSYFGFQAVSQINLKQGPMRRRSPQAKPIEAATPSEKAAVDQLVGPVHDDGLKATLARLGQMVYARSRKP